MNDLNLFHIILIILYVSPSDKGVFNIILRGLGRTGIYCVEKCVKV